MDELLFPVAALALTFLVFVPAMTLVSRAVLVRKRQNASNWAEYGTSSTYAWLVVPVLLPVAWLASSAAHELEAGAALRSCFIDHIEPACSDTLLLIVGLLGGGLFVLARQLRRAQNGVPRAALNRSTQLVLKARAVVQGHPGLRGLRIRVVSGSRIPLYTSGILRPIVSIDACFLEHADEEMLRGALLHERAHITAGDIVRVFVAQLFFSVNPLGHLLRPELEHWRQAREACCDGDAVAAGGEPMALAAGIIHAARFDCLEVRDGAFAALCDHDDRVLKLRLMLLMNSPLRTARSLGQFVLFAVVVVAIAAPHFEGFQLLSTFHYEIERLLHPLV